MKNNNIFDWDIHDKVICKKCKSNADFFHCFGQMNKPFSDDVLYHSFFRCLNCNTRERNTARDSYEKSKKPLLKFIQQG